MDTIGLLAAWVAVISFLFAVLVAIAWSLSGLSWAGWWATTNRKRAEKRLERLLRDVELSNVSPSNEYMSDLISLYGSMILNLVAAVGLAVISIEILDLGPALLAATLPFNINSKLLVRTTGILTLVFTYFFIFRLSYFAAQIRVKTAPRKAKNAERMLREISRLRGRLYLPTS